MFRLEYIPVSYREIALTQSLVVTTDGDAHPFIPLGCDDGTGVFGLEPTFDETIAALPVIDDPRVCAVATILVDSAFTIDPPLCIDTLLGDVSNTLTQEDCTVEFSVTAIKSDLANEQLDHETSDPDTEHNTQKRRRKLASLQGHTTGRRSHQRKSGFKMQNKRYRKGGLLSCWAAIFDRLSDAFNPLEQNLLKSLALIIAKDGNEEAVSLSDLDLKNFPYGTLTRMWNVVVAGAKQKMVRQKAHGSLKKELEKVVGIETFKKKLSVPKGSREASIIQSLLRAAKALRCDSGNDSQIGTENTQCDQQQFELTELSGIESFNSQLA